MGCLLGGTLAGGVSFLLIAQKTTKRITSGTNHDWDFLRISIALVQFAPSCWLRAGIHCKLSQASTFCSLPT
ncbi:hypothetical protein METHPM2_110076 [Pseudomonas sp. PM2]